MSSSSPSSSSESMFIDWHTAIKNKNNITLLNQFRSFVESHLFNKKSSHGDDTNDDATHSSPQMIPPALCFSFFRYLLSSIQKHPSSLSMNSSATQQQQQQQQQNTTSISTPTFDSIDWSSTSLLFSNEEENQRLNSDVEQQYKDNFLSQQQREWTRQVIVYLCQKFERPYKRDLLLLLSPLIRACIEQEQQEDFRTDLYYAARDWLNSCAPFLWYQDSPTATADTATTTSDDLKIQFSCFTKLFRFVLQYHDPELSVHFDKHRKLPEDYILPWLNTLFVRLLLPRETPTTSLPTTDSLAMQLWILLLSHWNNPLFVCFFGMALLRVNRSKLLELTEDLNMEAISSILSSSLLLLDNNSAADELSCATKLRQVYEEAIQLDAQTPFSAKYQFFTIMHPTNISNIRLFNDVLSESVVLPVPTSDVVEGFKKKPSRKTGANRAFRYIIIDCRSMKSFRFARLPTAVHIGDHVGYDKQKMQAILSRFESAKGSHFTIFGTGRGLGEEENLLKVIAMRFIAQNFEHISVTLGGFKETIKYISKDEIEYVRDEVRTAKEPSNHPEESTAEHIASRMQNLLSWGKQVATEYMEGDKVENDDGTSKVSQFSSRPAFTLDDDEFEDAYDDWQMEEQDEEVKEKVIKLQDLKKLDDNVIIFSAETDPASSNKKSAIVPAEKRYIAIGPNFILSIKPHPTMLGCGIILWERTLRQLTKISYRKEKPNRLTFDLKANNSGTSSSIHDVYIITQHSECIKQLQQNISALKSSA